MLSMIRNQLWICPNNRISQAKDLDILNLEGNVVAAREINLDGVEEVAGKIKG